MMKHVFAAFMRSFVLAGIVLPLSACGSGADGSIQVEEQWVRETSAAVPVGAAYARIRNGTGQEVRLIGGETPLAGRVEIHSGSTEHGIARMRHEGGGLPISPGGELALQPGGDHIMLMELKRPIRAGEQVPLTLRFEGAPAVTLQFPARSAAEAAHGGHHE